jgi:hypothetical protein
MPSTLGVKADLDAYPPQPDGYALQMMGYHSPGDGGGGLFVFSGGVPVRVTERKIVSVKQFGARGDNTHDIAGADDYGAIMAALEAVSGANTAGIVIFPAGRYRVTHKIVPPYGGVTLQGDGGPFQSAVGFGSVSSIVSDHGEDAVLSLQGIACCHVHDLGLIGGALSGAYPQTGLLLGRTYSSSCGNHTFDRLGIVGKFGSAAYYNSASEGNTTRDLSIGVSEDSPALYGIFLTGNATAPWTPEVQFCGSSLLVSNFSNAQVSMAGASEDISAVYIDGSVALGYILFHGGYISQQNGSYITIRSGVVDGMDTLGPIVFDTVGGEPGGGNPIAGFSLVGTAGCPVALRGLDIRRCCFGMSASSKYILQDNYVKLINARICSYGARLVERSVVLSDNQIGALYSGANAIPANLVPGTNGNCQIDVGFGPLASTPK